MAWLGVVEVAAGVCGVVCECSTAAGAIALLLAGRLVTHACQIGHLLSSIVTRDDPSVRAQIDVVGMRAKGAGLTLAPCAMRFLRRAPRIAPGHIDVLSVLRIAARGNHSIRVPLSINTEKVPTYSR